MVSHSVDSGAEFVEASAELIGRYTEQNYTEFFKSFISLQS